MNGREGKEETGDGTERDENGESTRVIGPGDDDGGNELDERIGVGASIDSVTDSVKFRIGSAGSILPRRNNKCKCAQKVESTCNNCKGGEAFRNWLRRAGSSCMQTGGQASEVEVESVMNRNRR